ncbi:MAG TPA: response regulator transcription factor [Opitutaceae bacterium]|nr:response regulator transcription factor [Opitutaceae bacterium]
MNPGTKTRPIRLLLVDDHPFVREGLRAYLTGREGLQVVGEAADGETALGLARRLRPDVVLMDVNLPGMNGIAAATALRRALPSIRVLMLTVHARTEYLLQMLRAGAHGYVAKDAPPAELLRAIQKVAEGGTHFSNEVALAYLRDHLAVPRGMAVAAPERLTRRERDVLALLADGLTNKQMAARLEVSARTVETYRERLKQKLGLRTVAELTRFALTQELFAERSGSSGRP